MLPTLTFRSTGAVAILALGLAARAAAARVQIPADVARLYAYDAALPLNAELRALPDASQSQTDLRSRWHLVYSSTHAQRVTAIFTVPRKFRAPFPAVILLGGSGGHKDSDYVRYASDLMSTLGYATISIDAQYHGERARPGMSGDIHLINSDLMRDAFVQTVVDLRRAADYLQSRQDIDGRRIGYMGISQGGLIGGTFIGVEPRITAACLALAGGGFIKWGHDLNLWKPQEEARAEANARVTDPVNFVGSFAPRPLLMLNASRDAVIPRYATEALFAAAGEPKTLVWFQSGQLTATNHILPPVALLVNVRGFFVEHLGKRTEIAARARAT